MNGVSQLSSDILTSLLIYGRYVFIIAAKLLKELRVSSISSEGCSMSLGIARIVVQTYHSVLT